MYEYYGYCKFASFFLFFVVIQLLTTTINQGDKGIEQWNTNMSSNYKPVKYMEVIST